ncbi:MAG: hypothetical protein WCI66_12400 [Gammaproteobacteria bacterium]
MAFTHGQGTLVWDEAGLLLVPTRHGIIRLLPAKMILEHVLLSCQA